MGTPRKIPVPTPAMRDTETETRVGWRAASRSGGFVAHALFRDTLAYVGESPWHRLGRRVPRGTASAEFIKAAGLDWEVECVPAPAAKEKLSARDGSKRSNRNVIRRPSLARAETERVAFAIVSSRYRPLQNRHAFGFFDPRLRGWADLEAAGALHDGEVIWVHPRVGGGGGTRMSSSSSAPARGPSPLRRGHQHQQPAERRLHGAIPA